MTDEAIEKKLDKIDKQLDTIHTLMLDTALQQKDIDQLKEKVKKLEEEQSALKSEVEGLKNKDNRKKAQVFDSVLKYIGTAILGACITALAVGLKVLYGAH